MRETGKQTKVQIVQVVADYNPDTERMLEALLFLLDADESLPADEHSDAAILSDSVS